MTTFRDALVRSLAEVGVTADVVLTENRTTLVSIVPKKVPLVRGGKIIDREVRVSSRFAALGSGAADAVVGFATGRRGAKAQVQALIRTMPRDDEPRSTRTVLLDPRGRVHDLAAIAEGERAQWFPATTAIPIGWGRGRGALDRGKRLRSIRLGSYEPTLQAIRIHPRLDDARVPTWFIGFVIFHEYLHHVLGVGPKVPGGVRRMHTPEFRCIEQRHPRYLEALQWESEQLLSVLSARW